MENFGFFAKKIDRYLKYFYIGGKLTTSAETAPVKIDSASCSIVGGGSTGELGCSVGPVLYTL